MISWIIDKDHTYREGDPIPSRAGKTFGPPVSKYQYKWRTLDDDGIVMYSGRSTDDSSLEAFAPLDFSQADVGATSIQYKNENGDWETL